MDCIRAQELLSLAADGVVDDATELATALTHCDECPRCAAFARGLEILAAVDAPSAPSVLIGTVLERIADARSMMTTGATPKSSGAVDDLASHQEDFREKRVRASWWAPRLTVFATAAVVVLTVLSLTAIGSFGGMQRLTADKSDDSVANLDEQTDQGPLLGAPEAADSTAALRSSAEAPAYISVDGRVFTPAEATAVDESVLITVGPIAGRSAEGTTAPLYAFDPGTGDATIVAEEPGSGWITYRRVVRSFAGSLFQLTTHTPMTISGLWPDLPAQYPAPSDPDGSPTFRFFGYDELGVKVFVPGAGKATDGFAIAPGTAPDDPAAGNPGWTWWTPIG